VKQSMMALVRITEISLNTLKVYFIIIIPLQFGISLNTRICDLIVLLS